MRLDQGAIPNWHKKVTNTPSECLSRELLIGPHEPRSPRDAIGDPAPELRRSYFGPSKRRWPGIAPGWRTTDLTNSQRIMSPNPRGLGGTQSGQVTDLTRKPVPRKTPGTPVLGHTFGHTHTSIARGAPDRNPRRRFPRHPKIHSHKQQWLARQREPSTHRGEK